MEREFKIGEIFTASKDYDTIKKADKLKILEIQSNATLKILNLSSKTQESYIDKHLFCNLVGLSAFNISVSWESYGTITVEGFNSLEEALIYAKENIEKISLPEGYYIDESFKIEEDSELNEALNQHFKLNIKK